MQDILGIRVLQIWIQLQISSLSRTTHVQSNLVVIGQVGKKNKIHV